MEKTGESAPKKLPKGLMLEIKKSWLENPISPQAFAKLFLKKRRDLSLTPKALGDILKTTEEYVMLTRPSRRSRQERFLDSRLERGALMFVDTAHFPTGYVGGKYALVAICAYSQSAHFEAMQRITGASAANAFQKIILRFLQGPIRAVVHDYGTEFMSWEFKDLCASFGIRQRPTWRSIRHKAFKAESVIKRLRTILGRLRKLGGGHQLPQLLHRAENALNSLQKSRITGLTPNETTNEVAPHVLVEKMKWRGRVSRGVNPSTFKIGDRVLMRLPPTTFDKTGQDSFYKEVYLVVGVKPTVPKHSYRLEKVSTGERLRGAYAPSQLSRVKSSIADDTESTSSPTNQQTTPPSRASIFPEPPFTRSRARLLFPASSFSEPEPLLAL